MDEIISEVVVVAGVSPAQPQGAHPTLLR